jgi:hypothetical protein
MPDQDEIEHFSPKDMREWVQQEIKDSAKAHQLRTKELESLATAYEAGKLTPAQADEAKGRYEHRWHEALPGAYALDHLTDEQILAKMDAARALVDEARAKGDARRRIFEGSPGDGKLLR